MDFLPMKGIEYLIVIGYLALLIPFWYLLVGRQQNVSAPGRALASGPRSWFTVPDRFSYHPGHTWAEILGGNRLRVGMDDFAHKLVGPVDALHLPRQGDELTAGDHGWWLEADGHTLGVLSPVTGRVVAVNDEASRNPEQAGQDPYDAGWLMEVEVPSVTAALRNLLHGKLARLWTEDAAEQLSRRMSPELGTVLADGGLPVAGLARALEGDQWWRLAEELLLVEGEHGSHG